MVNKSRLSGRLEAVGFTLIELLVVVLIVGILAAIAVPQYQKAMERAQASQALTLLKSVGQAYEAYYLANGSYADSFSELTVDIPWTGTRKVLKNGAGGEDARSNDKWSIQIQTTTHAGASVIIHMARISGKYKGAGFSMDWKTTSGLGSKKIGCAERLATASYVDVFDSRLAPGAYCEQIMHWQPTGSTSTFARSYKAP